MCRMEQRRVWVKLEALTLLSRLLRCEEGESELEDGYTRTGSSTVAILESGIERDVVHFEIGVFVAG